MLARCDHASDGSGAARWYCWLQNVVGARAGEIKIWVALRLLIIRRRW
jgi:hypothetical protein